MENALQSRSDGVLFRRPTFKRDLDQFLKNFWRRLEWYGRIKAARTLKLHGYDDIAKNLLDGYWK